MLKYSLNQSQLSDEELKEIFVQVKEKLKESSEDLDIIFNVALLDRELFPVENASKNGMDEREYLEKWVGKYMSAMQIPPSKHVGEPKKACSDPVLALIVENTKSLVNLQIEEMEKAHNLFMAAENIQGGLLEEYISYQVKKYGWIWCAGNTLRAVDFCNLDGSSLLQIKNKYNTENSSSSAIRNGTIIQKWYRVKNKTQKGKSIPVFRWEDINAIIDSGKKAGNNLIKCDMNEKSYRDFVTRTVRKNNKIISDL